MRPLLALALSQVESAELELARSRDRVERLHRADVDENANRNVWSRLDGDLQRAQSYLVDVRATLEELAKEPESHGSRRAT